MEKLQEFDKAETGLIKACFFVQILKHNLHNVFEESELIGLQYELECLSTDHLVDYSEFLELFIRNQTKNTGPN